MKKVTMPVLCLALTILIGACHKGADSPANESLTASKTSGVKIGEPVQFTLSPNSANNVAWSVSPSASSTINATGNHASILFGAKGNYTITTADGTNIATTTVAVNDSFYVLAARVNAAPFSSGRQAKVKASWVDSGAALRLFFSAQTANRYPRTDSILAISVRGKTDSAAIVRTGNSYALNRQYATRVTIASTSL